jgi:hypothetical protein
MRSSRKVHLSFVRIKSILLSYRLLDFILRVAEKFESSPRLLKRTTAIQETS